MASVQAISNTILKRAFEDDNEPVTPMKLQKLMYFVYREYLQRYGQRLFGENFQTWKYGPVLSSVYDEFKSFGSRPIDRFGRDAKGDVYVINERKRPDIIDTINTVWDKYKKYDGVELSQKTHKIGTAWYKAYISNSPYLADTDIRNDIID